MPDANATYEEPLVRKVQRNVAAVTIAADLNTDIYQAEADSVLDGVAYIAKAAVTGAVTDFRTLVLVNKGAAGSGTTVMATLILTTAVNLAAQVAKAITLSVVAGALAIAAGDILEWQSTHTGAGLVDPGGLVVLTIGRT